MDFPLSLSSPQDRIDTHGIRLSGAFALSLALIAGVLLSPPVVEASEAPAKAAKASAAASSATAKARQNKAQGKKKAAAAGTAATAALVVPAADAQQIDSLQAVMLGTSLCEFNQQIHVATSTQYPGYVDLSFKNKRWLMKPVLSPTGALRLEDVGAEALLIQIRNKSMVMNQRTGQRMVDGCVHPDQQALMDGR
ncbi:MAG: hypothetical protein Q4A16_04560 [Lautropia sp.]|nr:hypothetical protein [Lautropia sp.]